MTAPENETSLFPRFTGEEYARRYHAVRQAMKDQMSRRPLILGARELFRVHYLSNYLAQSTPGFCSPTVKKRRVCSLFQPSALCQGCYEYQKDLPARNNKRGIHRRNLGDRRKRIYDL
jgi:hypothetical protein